MFGTLIKFTAETVGQIIGEVAHQAGEICTAITEIPEALQKGYDKELFHTLPTKSTEDINLHQPTETPIPTPPKTEE